MADEDATKALGERRYLRRARSATIGSGPAALAVAVLSLLAVACGGETTPAIGNEPVPTSAVITTTTASTLPPTTTTTVDFDRAPSQSLTEVPANATGIELGEVADDIRGPTRDASEQLNRLATFIDLPSPLGAQIMDFDISVKPDADDDDRNRISSQLTVRAPQGYSLLVDFYHDQMRSLSWNRAAKTEATVGEYPATVQIYRFPGKDPDEAEVTVEVVDGPVSVITVDYEYLTEDDDESFDRLEAWQSDIRVPSSAEQLEAQVYTNDDVATLAVTYLLEADSTAEAKEDVVDLVRPADFDQQTANGSGLSTSPVVLIDELGQQFLLEFSTTGEPELIEMVVSSTFDLQPID